MNKYVQTLRGLQEARRANRTVDVHSVVKAVVDAIADSVETPQAAWYEDSTGCFHLSLDVAIIEENAAENGHRVHYLYGRPVEPAVREDDIENVEEAVMGMDWLGTGSDSASADRERAAAERSWEKIKAYLRGGDHG
jgi:hypothetical protein